MLPSPLRVFAPSCIRALLLASSVCLGVFAVAARGDQTLFDQQSPYNRVIVTQSPSGQRFLRFDSPTNPIQSAYDPAHPQRLLAIYTRAVMAGLTIVPQPRRILVIGLGGGSISKFLHHRYPRADIDSVEIDPLVIEAARRCFDFREDDHNRAHRADGRAYLAESADRFDLIILDAFGPESAPYPLITREFLRIARDHLTEQGIVIANIQGPAVNKLYFSMILTYQDVFDELHIVKAPSYENRIFLALPRKRNLTKANLLASAAALERKRPFEFDLVYLIQTGYEVLPRIPRDARLLLDADKPPQ